MTIQSMIRVVFNASQKATSGKSLNDFLHVGPKLQTDLPTIITRWRFFKYVFTADIVKMFRQFRVSKPDTNWLRILWRFDPEQQLQVYLLLTLIGTLSSHPLPQTTGPGWAGTIPKRVQDIVRPLLRRRQLRR